MEFVEGVHWYREGEYVVLTARFLAERGFCCASGCRHCPYVPRHGGAEAVLPAPELES